MPQGLSQNAEKWERQIMELEERVKSLKRRLAVLNAKVRPSDESENDKTKAEVPRQESDWNSRSSRLRDGLTKSKETD
jgi:hypothetical protein|tara:strand:+ start:1521 stop:1754 length:234 start_codon:yes stop_codon:yes gene_type:complete